MDAADLWIEENLYKIDRVAIDLLDPGKPIIPRKVLFIELR
jgi:hypothetical protein